MRAERNERSRREYNHQEDKNLGIGTGLETTLEIVLEIHKIEIEGIPKRANRSRNKSRNSSRDRSNDRARNGRSDSRQKSNRHCEYCNQDGHTWKYCWEM